MFREHFKFLKAHEAEGLLGVCIFLIKVSITTNKSVISGFKCVPISFLTEISTIYRGVLAQSMLGLYVCMYIVHPTFNSPLPKEFIRYLGGYRQ